MLRLTGRGSKTGMGLLEGLKELEGAPLPAPATSNGGSSADTMSQFSSGAKTMLGGLGGLGATLGEGAGAAASQVRRLFGDDEPVAQATFNDEVNALCSLTWYQRLGLFVMTFGVGVLMLITSISFLPMIVFAPQKFAGAFSMGNVLCIMSTWLLVGPRAQLAAMFQPGRALAAGMYVGSIIAVLLAAFFGGPFKYPLVLICVFIEILSLGWYALSYVPYGRTMITRAASMTGWV